MQDIRLSDALGDVIVRVFRRVNRLHNRALKPHGLSAEQAHILQVLWLEGPMSIGRLQRHLFLSSATLTGAIDRMEKIELVKRMPDPEDRRSVQVVPAKMSAKKRRALTEVVLDTEERLFGGLTKNERKLLLSLLHKVAEGLDGK